MDQPNPKTTMRKNLHITALLFATLLPLMVVTHALSGSSRADADGKSVFVNSNCGNCHSVSGAGIVAKMKSEKMRGPDLDGIGGKRDSVWLTGYLKTETDLEGRRHKVGFKGSDEELKTLVDWLLEQK